jgi:hypothetical protein
MKNTTLALVFCLAFISLTAQNTLSLAGEWRFQIDSLDKGISEKWFTKNLAETIKLPGSMLENNKGDKVTLTTPWTGSIYDSSWYFNPRMLKYRQPENLKFPFFLTPAKHYIGGAWYQKDVEIPQNWVNQRIVLYLERPHYESRIWVDDKEIPFLQNSLCVPHEYDLTAFLSVGTHRISVRIDNRTKEINVGQDSHSITDQTQGNWNGIVGKIELQTTGKVWLDDIQVYPDLKNKKAVVKMVLKNSTGKAVSGRIYLTAESFNSPKQHKLIPLSTPFEIQDTQDTIQTDWDFGDEMQTWDEFSPALYKLKARFQDNENEFRTIQFGMREFTINGHNFNINGRPIFLRGTVENCVFPLTGYAPMDVASWERIYRIAKNHGLNHFRFHSFCPPEAAFIAADLVGFYLQPEGPSWANHGSSLGDGLPVDQYIFDETDRMAKSYGNYASFCMLAYGNEPRGGKQVAYQSKFVKYWRAKDPRRVYTGASVGGSWAIAPDNEFMVRAEARNLPWGNLPSSLGDYRAKIEKFTVPFVTHEMGQWCAFPNFKEIPKYTGVLKAKNFELFQEDLADHNMGGLGDKFFQASGKLQALAYKTELETAFRTPNLNGFQMLGLNDYSGQGTALVGVLDAFWDEKGYISPKEFRRFCNTTVPLVRLEKFVFTSNTPLSIKIEMAHFGEKVLKNATVLWTLTDVKTKAVFAEGAFKNKDISFGNALPIGESTVSLSKIDKPTQLKLEVKIENTDFANDWNIWVYPEKLPELAAKDILFTDTLDAKALAILNAGGKVFLQAAGKIVKGKEIVQYFQPAFWNTSWFKMRPPHTLGISLDPKHAAFADFLTDNHSDLQWWELLNRAQVMNFEDFPAPYQPLVQSIDTWFMNRKIGILAEMKIGKGKLLICSADVSKDLDKRPVARQFLYSLTRYMQSKAFNPTTTVDAQIVKNLFERESREQYNSYAKQMPDELRPPKKVITN